MNQVGLPKNLFTTLNLDHGAAEKLIASRSVDHVNFTGSVAGGRAIERAAAGTFTTLGLELGGKDPAYVRPDADFDFAVEQLVDGTFYNSGQCCCGIERIYVHEQVFDRFVGAFADLTARYELGSPLAQETTLGPMAAIRFADTVRAHTREALVKGASLLIEAEALSCRPRWNGVSDAAGARRCRSYHAGDDGGELWPRRRHHESRFR